jgi:hypothetical protein
MNKEGYMVDSPISITIDFERLKKSENPEQRQLADVLSAMADLRSGLASIEKKLEETLSSKQIGSLSKMRNTENKVNDILFYLLHSPQETLSSLEDMQNVLLELELSLKGSTSKRDFEMVYEKFKKLQILVTDLMKKQKMDVYRGEEMLHSLKSIL